MQFSKQELIKHGKVYVCDINGRIQINKLFCCCESCTNNFLKNASTEYYRPSTGVLSVENKPLKSSGCAV